MGGEKTNRTRLIQARLTSEEYQRIHWHFSRSTCRKMSDYVRFVLLEKPIRIKQRNESLDDFMTEMEKLRVELNAIGNNYNQAVRRLHTMSDFPTLKSWLQTNESIHQILLQKISEIKLKIEQINDQWLQS